MKKPIFSTKWQRITVSANVGRALILDWRSSQRGENSKRQQSRAKRHVSSKSCNFTIANKATTVFPSVQIRTRTASQSYKREQDLAAKKKKHRRDDKNAI